MVGFQILVVLIWSLLEHFNVVTFRFQAMKNDFQVMKAVGDYTRVSPADRQAALVKFLKRIEASPEAKKHLSDWGLRLARDGPVSLTGRLLESEILMFGGGYKERVNPAADFTRAATR